MVSRHLRACSVLVVFAVTLAWPARAQSVGGFVSLFNGKDLTGWNVPERDGGHWKVKDGDFAVIWARNYDKGRVVYNGLGHTTDGWDRPEIQRLWLELVEWSMGLTPGDATPIPAPVSAR